MTQHAYANTTSTQTILRRLWPQDRALYTLQAQAQGAVHQGPRRSPLLLVQAKVIS